MPVLLILILYDIVFLYMFAFGYTSWIIRSFGHDALGYMFLLAFGSLFGLLFLMDTGQPVHITNPGDIGREVSRAINEDRARETNKEEK